MGLRFVISMERIIIVGLRFANPTYDADSALDIIEVSAI